MENKTLTSVDPTFEFHVGSIIQPLNWEVSVLVDNIGAITFKLQKNVEPDKRKPAIWKDTNTTDTITANGTKVFKLVGGGHFRILNVGTPVAVFMSLSY